MDFDFLFDAIPTPIMVIDRDTLEIRKVNGAALTFYGHSEAEFLQLRLPDIRPEKMQGEIEGMIARFDDPTLPETPRLHVTKSGERRVVKVHARLIWQAGKAMILAAITDITKETELQREARAARTFLNNVVESLPTAIFAKDAATGQFVLYNSGAERIFGIAKGDLLGNTSEQIFDPNVARQIADHDRRTRHAGAEGVAEEKIFRAPGGPERIVRIKKVAIKDAEATGRDYILAVAEDVTEQRLREEHVAHLAAHDTLTGLANRWQFEQKLTELKQSPAVDQDKAWLAVHYIDLDGFKSANDTFGHAVGDGILKEAATRMKKAVRKEDIVVRLGGDEFAVVQTDVRNEREVRALAKRLVKSLSAQYAVDGDTCDIGASVGVCVAPSRIPIDYVMEEADRALYAAKREGKGRYVFRVATPAAAPPQPH